MNGIRPPDPELAKMVGQAHILGERPKEEIFECEKCGDRPPMVNWNPPGRPPHEIYRVPGALATQLPGEPGVVWLCLPCQTRFFREHYGHLVPVDPNAPPRKVVSMENRQARRKGKKGR